MLRNLRHPRSLVVPFLALALTLTLASSCGTSFTAEDIAANNRGVGLMGQFDFSSAIEVFAGLVEAHPDWHDASINLAIATLNRQKEGDVEEAFAILQGVLAADPENLEATYCQAILLLYQGRAEEGLGYFQKVAEADPDDAYAAYFAAQALVQVGQIEESVQWYQRSLAIDPYLRSGYYGAFQALNRIGRRDEARPMLETFQRLAKNPRARLAEIKYTRMGPKAAAQVVGLADAQPAPPPKGPLFAPAQPLASGENPWLAGKNPHLAACDINGDQLLDLFAAATLDPASGRHSAVLIQNPDGGFAADPNHPLAAIAAVNAALWGDLDNDGLVDVYLCRSGPNQLWYQTADGGWEDRTATAGVANGGLNTLDGAIFDADHDGDLDLFLVNADGPDELYNNDRDEAGTFRPLASDQGIAGGPGSRGVITADIDGDRDVDIVVLNQAPPHTVYLNDLLWRYRPAPANHAFSGQPIAAAVAADIDADGRIEIFGATPEGAISCWRPATDEAWQEEQLRAGEGSDPRLAVLDVSGDGNLELLATTASGWAAYGIGAGGLKPLFSSESDGRAFIPILLDAAAGPAVVGLSAAGEPLLWAPGPGRHRFAALSMSGIEDSGQAMRSNASGIGAAIAARVGSRWTVASTFRSHSGPGQGLQPIAVGLGGAEHIDFVTVDWTDGVFQSEMNLEAGQLHRIAETQRQMSSCPVLFAFNGSSYAFVSDLLGVGGIGYALGRGEYAPPRPRESLLLPAQLLAPRGDRFHLKLGEPMEEACYLDAVRLAVYDLPPGWQMVLDERADTGGPPATGAARYFRTELLPVAAGNERGQEVIELIGEADLRAAPPGDLDHRFIGRLRAEHVLTLSFDQPLDGPVGDPMLVADGWVEYPYSQTNFAAWQAGAAFVPPSVEALTADGRWVVVLEHFGYPAGMPRRMSVPLPDLPAGTTRLRLRTNQEVYWDRLAVAYAEECPQAQTTLIGVSAARVRRCGFPQRSNLAQRVPSYDYERRAPFWDTHHQTGYYTEFGPATELVTASDDALAIFGPGEEIHLEFANTAGEPAASWTRRFVFESFGWCKDMDLYTRDGQTVAPLPANGKDQSHRDLLHARYNTRFEGGR